MEKLPRFIWKISGSKTGPNVLILGGTHGDELTGIAVVKELIKVFGLSKSLHSKTDARISGNLYFGYGNPEAIKIKSRSASGTKDLNRCFNNQDLTSLSPFSDAARAQELVPLLRDIDFLLDIHATSSPSKPFVCLSAVNKEHFYFFPLFPVDTILTDPKNVLAADFGQKEIGTTDYFVNSFGGSDYNFQKYGKKRGLGFCFETGLETDLSKISEALGLVNRFLNKTGTVSCSLFEVPEVSSAKNQTVYQLVENIIAKEDLFTYELGMGQGWQFVPAGKLIGKYGNGAQEITTKEAYYLFPKAASKIKSGRSLYFLADKVKK